MNPLELHVAGATVRHQNPFLALDVPVSLDPLPIEVRETWVKPIYFGLDRENVKEFLNSNLHLVTDELIGQLIAQFDWRPKTAGAYFAALTDSKAFSEQIGRLLLRSEVCYAGRAYCVALAEFNDERSVYFLNEYLTYYLKQENLWFDQGQAIAALIYLDQINGTDHASVHIPEWRKFIRDKSNWSLDSELSRFNEKMATLHAFKRPRG